MAQALARRDRIADSLLNGLRLRKAAFLRARPNGRAVDADLEGAAAAGHEGHLTQLGLERRQQLLREVGRAEQPAAARAVLDLDPWASRSHEDHCRAGEGTVAP